MLSRWRRSEDGSCSQGGSSMCRLFRGRVVRRQVRGGVRVLVKNWYRYGNG